MKTSVPFLHILKEKGKSSMTTVYTISVNELDDYVNDKKVLIIDLRSREEYLKKHIKNAVNVPYEQLKEQHFPKDKELIFYCERGSSSLFAARELMKRGYNTKSVVGGFRSYRGANLYFHDFHSRMN